MMKCETGMTLDERLVQWLWMVARRADQLARQTDQAAAADRRVWLRAELEIFEAEECRAESGLRPAA